MKIYLNFKNLESVLTEEKGYLKVHTHLHMIVNEISKLCQRTCNEIWS